MEYRHEIIRFSNQIPGKVFLHRVGSVSRHWHRSMEILFVLSGTVNVAVDDKYYQLKSTDVIVINTLSPHEINSSGAEMMAFQTNLAKAPFGEAMKNCYFDCCSAGRTEDRRYNRLRNLLARLIKDNAYQEDVLLSYSLITQLLHELQTNFSAAMPENLEMKRNSLTQMNQITEYMTKNYRENLSLQDVANHFHYSTSYLSRLFRQNVDMTFLDFYSSIRLENAVSDLITGRDSINVIAVNNGFSSARSFTTVFQKKYGMLPSEYREKHPSLMMQSKAKTEVNYLEVTSSTSLSVLAAFLDSTHEAALPQDRAEQQFLGRINCTKRLKTLRHTWRTVCCVGSARDFLYTDIQEMVRRLQEEMPFTYVKFHGLLSDDLMICGLRSDGSLHIEFTLLDKVFDFLRSVGLKPWMQLGFMPRALASDPERTSFYTRQNCSLPRDIAQWNHLVRQLILHCISRYSLEEVLTWPFCVWNEPDTTVEMFGFAEKEDFFRFYEQTFRTVKSVHPGLRVGSPSLLFLTDDPLNWYGPFFRYCHEHDCVPEFFNLHYYNDDITLSANGSPIHEKEQIISKLSPDPDAFHRYLDEMEPNLEQYQLGGIAVYLTEWNLTVSHRNLLNDTCFKACYLIKNLLENYDRLEAFGYWSLTDLIAENQLPGPLFHGGLGLFTVNQIPKAHYFAFRLLTRLGDILISSGEGWFLTRHRTGESLSLILYNYHHYNKLVSSGELFDVTMTERYSAFTGMSRKQITLSLEGLTAASYQLRETFVNREHGSCYDSWVAMGGVELERAEEVELLRQVSQPGYSISRRALEDGLLHYSCVLEPLEVRLVEIEPIESI